jgi:uncharacterized membrane protein YbhN (UPF0104 family)
LKEDPPPASKQALPAAIMPEEVLSPAPPPRRRWRVRLLRLALGLGFLVAAAMVVSGRRHELLGVTALLGHVHPWWLGVAVVAEILSVLALVDEQRVLLSAGDAPVRMWPLTGITLGANALGTTLPGGQAWATVFTFRQYVRKGATRGVAAWALLAVAGLSGAALAAVSIGGIIAASDNGPSPTWELWLLVVLAGTVALGMILILRRPRPVARWAIRVTQLLGRLTGRSTDRFAIGVERAADQMMHVRPLTRTWTSAFIFAVLNWLADCACLCAGFLAVGVAVPWRGLLLAYAAGQLATVAAVTPGGIGVVEGSLAVTLVAYGAGDVSAIAAVLLYRIISYWGLLAVGWPVWLFLHYRRGGTPDLMGLEGDRGPSPAESDAGDRT